MIRAAITLAALVLLVGCSVRYETSAQERAVCELLDTALDEGQQFSEAWYLRAGEVLERCGVPRAKDRAERGACYARRFNDSSVVCP